MNSNQIKRQQKPISEREEVFPQCRSISLDNKITQISLCILTQQKEEKVMKVARLGYEVSVIMVIHTTVQIVQLLRCNRPATHMITCFIHRTFLFDIQFSLLKSNLVAEG